jgi:hypothetical protein
MNGKTSWDVPVVDGLDRERTLVVTVSEGRVAILPPPGEGFYLPTRSVWQLHEAIREASIAALKSTESDAVAALR